MRKLIVMLAFLSMICLLGVMTTGCDKAPESDDSDDTGSSTGGSFPSAPKQTSPDNGAVLYHVPRETTLKWDALSGAAEYGVQVMVDSTGSNNWTTLANETVATASYTFTFSGTVTTNVSQTVRWRVWGIDSLNVDGRRSDWSSITYMY